MTLRHEKGGARHRLHGNEPREELVLQRPYLKAFTRAAWPIW